MSIKIYETKKGFVGGWHTSILKNGMLEYYDNESGGYKKTKVFSFIEEIEHAESWFDVTEIDKKYGYNIAAEAANFLTAGIILGLSKWFRAN